MNLMEKDHYWRENDPRGSLYLPVPLQAQLEAIFYPQKPAPRNETETMPEPMPEENGENPPPEENNGENFEDPSNNYYLY